MIFKSAKNLLIYFIPLIIFSPIIDHICGELNKSKTDMQIVIEILIHILLLIIIWKYLDLFINKNFETDKNIPLFILSVLSHANHP